MGLVMSPGTVISQLDSMNENLQQAVSNAETMQLYINDFCDTEDSLIGKAYDSIREYFRVLHIPTLGAMRQCAAMMIQENNAYKNYISTYLSGISYVDEDALVKDIEFLDNMISRAHNSRFISTSAKMAYINSLENTKAPLKKELKAIQEFMDATAGLYGEIPAYIALAQSGIDEMGKKDVKGLSIHAVDFTAIKKLWGNIGKIEIKLDIIDEINEKIESLREDMLSGKSEALVEYNLLNYYRSEILKGTITIEEIEEAVHVLKETHPYTFFNLGVLYIHSSSDYNNVMERIETLSEACFSKPIGEEINGWLQLYDAPTVWMEGRTVNIPRDANRSTWASRENRTSINPYAKSAIGDSNSVITGNNGELVDENGRYWIAVGPNVINSNHSSNAVPTATEMNYGTKIDVVVKDCEGNISYIPCVVGECKGHTYPTGVVQTGRAFPDGGDYHPQNADGSMIEFCGKGSISGFSEYEIVDIIVYDGTN